MQIVIGKKNLAHIGTFLNNIRCDEAIKQEDLCKKIKMRQSNFSGLENNRRKPGLGTLVRILDVLGYELIIQKK